jgi:glycosyltransferase involved in cell wall biosynthesis
VGKPYAVVGSRTDGTRKNVFMPFSFVKAEDCPKKVAYKRDVGSWVGIEQDFFVLPSIKRNYPLGSTIVPELAIPMDDWLRFFGIWLAEGSTSYNSGYIIRVAQKQPDNCKIIKSWLDKIPIHSAKYGDSFVISNKQLWSYLRQFGKAKDKYIPKEYLGLSSRQLKILFDAMMLGDGNKTGNVYGTKSKRLADNIQEMLLKIGLAGTIGESFSIKNGKLLNIFRVSISSKNFCTPQANFPKDGRSYIDYDGMVYCVEVPNHIIYVRRNGKTVWCGNCRLGYDIEERIKQYNVPRNTIISPEDLTGFPKIWEAGDTIIEERGIARMADVNINATSGEGWGLINGEACSLGVPTISTKCSAVTEVVGKGGILVEPYCGYAGQYSIQDTARSVEGVTVNHEKLTEAILQLYGNKDERIELGCLGREHAMSYDFERQIIPAWSNILSSINPDEILLKMLNV